MTFAHLIFFFIFLNLYMISVATPLAFDFFFIIGHYFICKILFLFLNVKKSFPHNALQINLWCIVVHADMVAHVSGWCTLWCIK